jgi:hypothetical protein
MKDGRLAHLVGLFSSVGANRYLSSSDKTEVC